MNNYQTFWDASHNCFQLRSKDDFFVITFDDEEKKSIFENILDDYINVSSPDRGAIVNQLLKQGYSREKVLFVFSELEESGIIDSTDDDFDKVKDLIDVEISQVKVSIVGNSPITHKIAELSTEYFSGESSLDVHDNILEIYKNKSIEELVQKNNLLIVDAENRSPNFLYEINRLALIFNKPWLLIDGITGQYARIGPFFYGRETGCYQCLISRMKCTMEYASYYEEYENYLMKTNGFAKSNNEYRDVFYNILSAMACKEIRNFLLSYPVPRTFGRMLTVDTYTYEIITHSLLKVPTCMACTPKLNYNISPWLEPLSIT